MMKRSKINILLCDTFPGLLPPEIPSYASMFREMFRAVDGSLDLTQGTGERRVVSDYRK